MMTTTWATTLPLSPTNRKPLIFNKDRVSQSSFLFFSSCHRAQPRVHSGSLHAAWVVSVLLRTKDNEKMNATISSAIETLSGSLGSLSSSLDTLTAYVDQVVVCVMLFPWVRLFPSSWLMFVCLCFTNLCETSECDILRWGTLIW